MTKKEGFHLNKNRKINIISNKNFKSRKTSMQLIEKLSQRGFAVSQKYDNKAELNITVGGDGAFLRAIHRNKFPEIPFIGINTGNLGFFQEILPANIDDFINKYIQEDYKTEEMSLISSKIYTHNKTYHLTSVNEIAVKGEKSKVIHLDLFIDRSEERRVGKECISRCIIIACKKHR